MNRCIIIVIISLILFSCNRIEISYDDEVRITEKPLQIDSNYYSVLKDTFEFDVIDKVNINYGSLKPKVKLALGIKFGQRDSVLYWTGCMVPSGFNLIVQDSLGFHLIWNKQKLKEYFSPIETKEEALSYICAYTGLSPSYDFEIKLRYRKFVDTIRTTYSIPSENGYIINLFDYELCGCGPHTHFMLKYEVNTEGDIYKRERIDLYEDPKEDRLCID